MQQIKAIVIADDHYNGLGMVRSLGLANIDVTLLLMSGNKTFIDSSKYIKKCIKISKSEKSILQEIKTISEQSQNSIIVLFPLNDFSAQVIDENLSVFQDNVVCPNANGNILQLSDKYYIKAIAEKSGLLVPKGISVNLDIDSEYSWDIYPAIIKPLISVEGAKSDIVIVSTEDELMQTLVKYKDLGYRRALVEEYIDGYNSHMIEVMGARNSDGSIDYAGIIRKYREYPIKNGSTSYGVIVKSHEGIDYDIITSFLESIDYVGIFDIEYKFLNGKAYFIECNFRNGAPGFVFTKNGYNIPAIWIEKNLHTNLNIEKKQLSETKFMIEQNDFINMLKGTPKFTKWIKEYVRSCKVFCYKKDIKPVIKYYILFVVNQCNKIFRK